MDLLEICEVIAKNHPEFSDPESSVGLCDWVSRIVQTYDSRFEIVHVLGSRIPLPNRHEFYRRWKETDAHLTHTLNKYGDLYVDFTYRQLDSKSDFPRIVSKEQFMKEWDWSSIDPTSKHIDQLIDLGICEQQFWREFKARHMFTQGTRHAIYGNVRVLLGYVRTTKTLVDYSISTGQLVKHPE